VDRNKKKKLPINLDVSFAYFEENNQKNRSSTGKENPFINVVNDKAGIEKDN
jgi:hypothetical protein